MTELYKYKAFGVNTLELLCNSHVYYSDPTQFNDPLDCSPTVIADVSLQEIERLCYQMYSKNKGGQGADEVIQNIQYLTTEYGDYTKDKDVEGYYQSMLISHINQQLDKIMKNKGVLSLAGQWNSPLMWSHYADEHKGICIEYDISSSVHGTLKKIDYEGSRGIFVSTLLNWIFNDSQSAESEIEEKYFYTKASQWKYEEGSGRTGISLPCVYVWRGCVYYYLDLRGGLICHFQFLVY